MPDEIVSDKVIHLQYARIPVVQMSYPLLLAPYAHEVSHDTRAWEEFTVSNSHLVFDCWLGWSRGRSASKQVCLGKKHRVTAAFTLQPDILLQCPGEPNSSKLKLRRKVRDRQAPLVLSALDVQRVWLRRSRNALVRPVIFGKST